MAVFIALGAPGCTIARLWDFPLGECTTDAQCAEALNAAGGFPLTCRAYACRPDDAGRSTCVRLDPDETCDGADNDCDGVVDERSSVGEVVDPTPVMWTAESTQTVATDRDAQHAVWSYFGGTAAISALGSAPSSQEIHTVTYATTSANGGTLTLPESDFCVWGTMPVANACAPHDVRIDRFTVPDIEMGASRDTLVHAWVDQSGCAAGLLRLGIARVDAPGTVYAIGPARRSNSFAGLMPAPVGRCSANSTTACQDAIAADDMSAQVASCGVSRPALRALPGTNQGVLAFNAIAARSASAGRLGCGGEAVDVQAFAVFARPSVGSMPDRVDVSGEGVPHTLGQTTGGGRPGIVADRSEGTFVAYGDAQGDLALHYIPVQDAPPENNGVNTNSDDRTGVEVPPLMGVRLLATLDGAGGRVDDVALATGRVDLDTLTLTLGVTWREGNVPSGATCTNSSRIYFRRVLVPLDGDGSIDPNGDVLADEPVVLSGASAEVLAPGVAHLSSLVTSGFVRDGETVDDQTGGFIVAWHDSGDGALRARRIAEFDGLPLDADCPERGCAAEDIRVSVGNPVDLAIATDPVQRVAAFTARGGDGGESAALSCVP